MFLLDVPRVAFAVSTSILSTVSSRQTHYQSACSFLSKNSGLARSIRTLAGNLPRTGGGPFFGGHLFCSGFQHPVRMTPPSSKRARYGRVDKGKHDGDDLSAFRQGCQAVRR
jgi:hypothetical protein